MGTEEVSKDGRIEKMTENKIHCKLCGYVPTGFVYVEKCIYCKKRLHFPSQNDRGVKKNGKG